MSSARHHPNLHNFSPLASLRHHILLLVKMESMISTLRNGGKNLSNSVFQTLAIINSNYLRVKNMLYKNQI